MESREIQKIASEMRCDILEMIARAKSGHPGGSLSCIDILACLYFGDVLSGVENLESAERDRFILAKGHAAPALYAVLSRRGYFDREKLSHLREFGSILQGHPDMRKCPGVEVSTGSLGQGLSIACGEALSFKLGGSPESVFALLGDGECQEGQVWEAAMFAAQYKLDNLVAIIDNNGLQIDGNVSDVMSLGDVRAKFESFGWKTYEVDGHNIDELCEVLSAAKSDKCEAPKCVIAKTIKGKGVSFMENNASWHGKAPSAEELESALAEIRDNL